MRKSRPSKSSWSETAAKWVKNASDYIRKQNHMLQPAACQPLSAPQS
jgi:hypothetical protein